VCRACVAPPQFGVLSSPASQRHRDGRGERILAAAITERFTLTADGEFEALVEGSTKAVAQGRRHAGVIKVLRYTFDLA
jgi:hypothetical protein